MTTIIEEKNTALQYNVKEISSRVGNTPLYFLPSFSTDKVLIYAKAEWMQIGSSVKARAAYNIIKNAILEGHLTKDKVLLDATSGNTGIAYAAICAALGLNISLVLPANASKKRKQILTSLGVDLVFSSELEGTDGAQIMAKDMVAKDPEKYYYADQYNNQYNWKAHYETTAPEIINATKGNITHFIAGLGTTGTFVGTTRGLQDRQSNITCISLQPDSPLHGLEGWKHMETAIVPGIYDNKVGNGSMEVSTDASFDMVKKLAKQEGILVSPSAAANLVGAVELSKQIDRGVIVTIFPDDITKYDEVFDSLY